MFDEINTIEKYFYDMFDKAISKQHVLYDNNDVLAHINYLYDNEDIIVEADNNGTVLREIAHGIGIDNPLWSIDPTNINNYKYYTQDILGSIVNLTDNNGNITDTYNYKAFGKMDHKKIIPTDNYYGEIHYGYTGRTYNDINDLMDYRSRQYDPDLGQFTQYDSNISESLYQSTDYLEPNIYSHFNYANNNPLTFNDPLGKCFFPIFLEEDYMPPYRPDYAKGLDPNKTPVNVNPNLTNVWQIFKDRWITWLNDKANITVWRWNRRFIPDENKYTSTRRNEMSDGYTPFYLSDGYPTLSSASTPDPNKGLNDDEENEEAKPFVFIVHGILNDRKTETWMDAFAKNLGLTQNYYKAYTWSGKPSILDLRVVYRELLWSEEDYAIHNSTFGLPTEIIQKYPELTSIDLAIREEAGIFSGVIRALYNNATNVKSFNIVAHSGGGMITMNALNKIEGYLFDDVIFMGAPIYSTYTDFRVKKFHRLWSYYDPISWPFILHTSSGIIEKEFPQTWHSDWDIKVNVINYIKSVIND